MEKYLPRPAFNAPGRVGDALTIRTVTLDGNPWFVAADVCRALGLEPHKGGFSHHYRRLSPDEMRPIPVSQTGMRGRPATIISESGLYKLVLRSDKPEAKHFQDWVTREVLPAIRKDGAYVMGGAPD